jgi:hypothetical protein
VILTATNCYIASGVRLHLGHRPNVRCLSYAAKAGERLSYAEANSTIPPGAHRCKSYFAAVAPQ